MPFLASINTGMPRISRTGDRCVTIHPCDPTAPVIARQYSVFANGRAILTKGSRVGPHNYKPGLTCVLHKKQVLNNSSRTVFAEGIGVGRKGDRADGKGFMAGASRNVIAG